MHQHQSQPEPAPFSPELRLAAGRCVQARAEADVIVKNHVIVSSGLGLVPMPLLDGAALANVQLNLVGRLADHYGVPSTPLYPSMLLSVTGGALPFLLTAGAGSLFKFIPGPGSLAGGMLQSVLASAVTYAVGHVFMEHFEAGGTLADLDFAALRKRFRLQFRHGLREGRQLARVGGR